MFSDDSFHVTSHSVNKLYSDAKKLLAEKKYDKAIQKLEICQQTLRCSRKLIHIYSTIPEIKNIALVEKHTLISFQLGDNKVYHNLALLFYQDNNSTKAQEYFYKSGNIAKVYESYFNLGMIYMKEGNNAKALESFKKASLHDIKEADYMLGIYYYKNGKIEKSKYYLTKSKNLGFDKADIALKKISR